MTRIRLDLSDYDFTILYKKGKMNTNADALSRIKIDSDILKQMIPLENDEKEKKILITTRAMKNKINEANERKNIQQNNEANKNKINENNELAKEVNMGKCDSQKSDQLLIWECISINDVKNMKKLQFNKFENIKEKDISIENNIVHIGRNDNSPKPVSNEEIMYQRNMKNNENNKLAGFSDNSAKLDSILRKLISKMNKENIKELALSTKDEIFKVYTKEEIKEAYAKIKINNKSPQLKILIYNAPTKITDGILQYKLIDEYHNATHAGHLGIRKTIIKLKQRYIWKNMSKMVKKFVSYCNKCQTNKQTKHIKEPLTLTDTPNNSFEVISIDTVGPLRISNDYRYILTMQCELTKFVVAHPMPTKDALTTAKTLVEQFILKYGQFKVLKSDRGTEFINETMRNICSLLNIKQIFATPYHHETLGSVERNHRVLNEFLLTTANDYEWDKWIPYFTFAYNTAPHIDTGYSPYELVYGKLPSLPSDIVDNNTKFYNYDDYAQELRLKLQFTLKRARELSTRAKENRTTKNKYENRLNLKIGDLVLVKVENRKKNQSPYKGPYRIISRNGVNTTIDYEGKIKEIHNNNLKPYKTLSI